MLVLSDHVTRIDLMYLPQRQPNSDLARVRTRRINNTQSIPLGMTTVLCAICIFIPMII